MIFPKQKRDLDRANQTIGVQNLLIIGLLSLSIILSVTAFSLVGRERVILVPPTVSKSFWLDSEKVSGDYLDQMALFLAHLMLNVSPRSVDFQAKTLLQYASPEAYAELKTAMASTSERLKRDNAVTLFQPVTFTIDEPGMRVVINGVLATYIGDKRVTEASKVYLIEFRYSGGKLYLSGFKETPSNDPFNLKSSGVADARPGA
ncbi:MAG TPA: type IV conjugative transfer system protein TraE [Burkholderiales bacterium]|jgi:conjugal transfer pilus assembly protein TraE|nr:type IV conjugative transfer system protein TraE [Burkholderiales bacterium]